MTGYDDDDWFDRHTWVYFIPIIAAYALIILIAWLWLDALLRVMT